MVARERDPDFMNRLAQAGLEIFARDGLAGARMSDVADHLGVSQGTLYNYVESKEALFCLALDRATGDTDIPLPEDGPLEGSSIESIQRGLEEDAQALFRLWRLDEALGSPVPDDVTAELRVILNELHDRLAETRWAADVIERSAREIPELSELFFQTLRRSVVERLARYIELRSGEGRFRKVRNPRVTARLVLETVDYAARGRHRDPDPVEARDRAYREAASELLIPGLVRARPARVSP